MRYKCYKKTTVGWDKAGGGWVYIYKKNGFRGMEDKVVISTSNTGGSNPKDRINKGFETKEQAIKYAKKFMKENDKC